VAERPIFAPHAQGLELVDEIDLEIKWHAGFAPSQKQKNIEALHEAAANAGYRPVLEVSTKSADKVGRHLSAFHLRVSNKKGDEIPLESAFQGSKVFESGGPYVDLHRAAPVEAKRDLRLRESGKLTGFAFDDLVFPLEPKTAFYDWLFISAIYPHREWLQRLAAYAAFSDIEFNPARSINCQARSCALFFALRKRDLLQDALLTPKSFVALLSEHGYPSRPIKGDAAGRAEDAVAVSTNRRLALR